MDPVTPPTRPRASLFVFATLAIVGLVALFWLRAEIESVRSNLDVEPEAAFERLTFLTRVVFGSLGVLLGVCGLALAVLGVRGWVAGQFPPADSWLAGDAAPVAGTSARRRAGLAIVAGIFALAGAWLLPARALDIIEAAVDAAHERRQPPIDWKLEDDDTAEEEAQGEGSTG